MDSCFRLPIQLVVLDLLYARELANFGGPELIKRGLVVEELTANELTIAQEVRRGHPKLSLPDAFAYSLASARGWVLLTGDGELRSLAQPMLHTFSPGRGKSKLADGPTSVAPTVDL